MQDLTLLPVSMTSLEIAEITCKPHKLILRSIRKILAELEQNKEVLPIIRSNNVLDYEAVYPTAKHAQYIDSAGNPHTMYILNKRFAQLVSMEVDIVRRLAVLNYIEEQNRQLLRQHIADQEKIHILKQQHLLEAVNTAEHKARIYQEELTGLAVDSIEEIAEMIVQMTSKDRAENRQLKADYQALQREFFSLRQDLQIAKRGRRIRYAGPAGCLSQ